MIRTRRSYRPETMILIAAAVFGLALPAAAQKKSAPAPAAKPAAPAAKPAAPAAAHPAAGATSTAHPASGATTASHGPTTSGATTASHGPTTSSPHGPTTGGATTAGAHGTTTGGFGGTHAAAGGARGPEAHGAMGHAAPVGGRDVHMAGGNSVRMRPGGRPADFHDARRGMDIHHNLAGGGRRVMVERPDHSRLVFERGRPGYIGRPYMYHGHEFARRSYYYHGRVYDRYYNPYRYHGLALEVYAPGRYYGPGFYGWAYNPWASPVAYSWGFAGAPGYGYYGAYYAPYPVYPTPSLGLTDYLISTSLQANYEAQLASGPPPPMGPDAAPLTADVKQLVADEVQRQIALENAESQQNAAGRPIDPASSSIARQLADGQPHAFIAGSEVDVVDATGQECAVTDGDVLQLTRPPAPDATEASLVVMSSKGGKDCHKSAVVSVSLDQLQEMQNHMRETVDQGLADLQTKQGKGGLPAAPPSAMAPPTMTAFAQEAPPADPKGADELQTQAQVADQSEHELIAQAGTQGGPSDTGAPAPAAPAAPTQSLNIAVGQTTAEIKGMLGEPQKVINLGPKTIYVYKDMKITFKAGKVSDIE